MYKSLLKIYKKILKEYKSCKDSAKIEELKSELYLIGDKIAEYKKG